MGKCKKTVLILLVLASLLCACQKEPPVQTTAAPETTAPVLTFNPYVGMTKEEFYANYTPAVCYQDAMYRTEHHFLSGSLEVPGQYAVEAEIRPKSGSAYIRNTDCYSEDDGNTYIVVNSWGEVFGNMTGGGEYSSKRHCNPTPYVPTAYESFSSHIQAAA